MNNYEQKYPIPQKILVDVNIIKKLKEDFERAINSTLFIRNTILQNYPINKLEDSYNNKALDHHSMVAFDSFVNSISMLKGYEFDDFAEKQKLNESDLCKYNVFANQKSPICYKKRKICGELLEKEVIHLTDDGFAWRKYGQKVIHDCPHPRHYYRCTHKNEQNCQATKQIQQISENPTKYKLIYQNNHKCNNNILNTSPYMINSSDEHSSAFVLSFDGSNPVNPMLFPEPTFHPTVLDDAKDMKHMMITKTSEVSSSNTVKNSSTCSTSVSSADLDEDYSLAEFFELFPDLRTTL